MLGTGDDSGDVLYYPWFYLLLQVGFAEEIMDRLKK